MISNAPTAIRTLSKLVKLQLGTRILGTVSTELIDSKLIMIYLLPAEGAKSSTRLCLRIES